MTEKTHLFKLHQTIHLGRKPFTCIHCNKVFSSSLQLKKHKRNQHWDYETYNIIDVKSSPYEQILNDPGKNIYFFIQLLFIQFNYYYFVGLLIDLLLLTAYEQDYKEYLQLYLKEEVIKTESNDLEIEGVEVIVKQE